VFRVYLKDDGVFPNNENAPLLLYKNVKQASPDDANLLTKNGWQYPWTWGIYPFHHYHSVSWEALLCIRGNAVVQVGGPQGPELEIIRGDLILIPPGVAHKQISERDNFALLGTYPVGSPSVDTIKGKPSEKQLRNISECPIPPSDPIFGKSSPWGDISALF